MEQRVDEDVVFKNVKAAVIEGSDRIFENCKFISCDFSYADFSHQLFINCEINNCNLSLLKVTNTGFQTVTFQDCKIAGVNFSNCRDFSFSVDFTHCILDYTIFHAKRLKAAKFIDCSLIEADFTEADLTNAILKNCNLDRTIFNRTQLAGADLSTAYNFDIDPQNNNILKAKFSADSLWGLLSKYKLVIR